ncbi:DNA-directed RNA polymerase I subunit RPA12 [Linum grandiflorum]
MRGFFFFRERKNSKGFTASSRLHLQLRVPGGRPFSFPSVLTFYRLWLTLPSPAFASWSALPPQRVSAAAYTKKMMSARRGDFMFCNLCGTMMVLSSGDQVKCPLCKSCKKGKDVDLLLKVIVVMVQDIRKDLGISHFEGKMEVKDMEINKQCEKCSNTKLKFSTRQMRSADEGQTTFYHCSVCSHTFTEN